MLSRFAKAISIDSKIFNPSPRRMCKLDYIILLPASPPSSKRNDTSAKNLKRLLLQQAIPLQKMAGESISPTIDLTFTICMSLPPNDGTMEP